GPVEAPRRRRPGDAKLSRVELHVAVRERIRDPGGPVTRRLARRDGVPDPVPARRVVVEELEGLARLHDGNLAVDAADVARGKGEVGDRDLVGHRTAR